VSLFVFVARYLGGDRRKSLRDDRSVIRTGFLSFWWRRTSSGVTKCDQMRDQSVHCIKITKMRYMERRYLSHYRKSVKNCFATQNFTEILTEIGKSAAELWLKTIFLNDGYPPSWILKIFIFGHVTITEFQICVAFVCQISSNSEVFSLRYDDFTILNFRGPIMGSLKSPCGNSYRSSIETIALNCFIVFEKIAFLRTHFGNRQTDKPLELDVGPIFLTWPNSTHKWMKWPNPTWPIIYMKLWTRPSRPIYARLTGI